jgi:hypothetical protein
VIASACSNHLNPQEYFAMSTNPKNLVIKENQDGTVTVVVTFYILAILATRVADGGVEAVQEPACTRPGVATTEEAQEFGRSIANQKWPEAAGWSHQVAVLPQTMTFDFTSGDIQFLKDMNPIG